MSVDLAQLLRAIGAGASDGGLVTAPEERTEPESPVEMIDEDIADVRRVRPLEVAAFVDGIQASRTLTHRDHRPVHLVYVAAGALGVAGRALGVRETLALLVSAADGEWARSLPGGVEVIELDEESPFTLAAAGVAAIGGARDGLERALVADLLDAEVGRVVVDGSLVGRPRTPEIVGVVKTTRTRYLDDETVLLGLEEGWRSPRFRITAGPGGAERYSCYLRLNSARHRPWDYGLIRVEAGEPALLDALAARCLAERQPRATRDRRGDRHLTSVANVETYLRARRPVVFDW